LNIFPCSGAGLPDFSCCNIPKWKNVHQIMPNGGTIHQICRLKKPKWHSKAYKNKPKLRFLVWKYNIWQPCSGAFPFPFVTFCSFRFSLVLSLSLCLCVSVSLCLCVSVSLCLCVSVSLCLSVSLSLSRRICQHIYTERTIKAIYFNCQCTTYRPTYVQTVSSLCTYKHALFNYRLHLNDGLDTYIYLQWAVCSTINFIFL
jgi:hypothetical protein